MRPVRRRILNTHCGERSRARCRSAKGIFKLGQRVRHPNFGAGVLKAAEGSGNHVRVQVDFENGGAKWLVLAYAPLSAAS